MKKVLGLVSLIPLVLGVWYVTQINKSKAPVPGNPVTDDSQVLSATPFPLENITATPAFEADSVELFANFTEQKTSEEIQSERGCTYLMNGGFYTKESTPVGLFMSNGQTLRNENVSALFDSFLTINVINVPRISRVLPKDPLRIAIQVGPLLIENAEVEKLSIRDDKVARRLVAAVTGDNKILFISVRAAYLGNLPVIIDQWAKEQNVEIADAVNLDGGSASAFRTPTLTLPEITPIGSAFCIK